jgi:hypothetical protein
VERGAPLIYHRLHVRFVAIVAALVDSAVVAEFAGYWLHRLLHIHRRSANGKGFMDNNSGIGWYLFDRSFPTPSKRHRPSSGAGYQAAIQRHGLDESELLSLRGCSTALFRKSDSRTRG